MKKGQRPTKHYRLIKTKTGRKRILVNKHIRKRFKKVGTIQKDERKIFNFLSNPGIYQKEYGGAIDFDLKGNIDNINVAPGEEFDVMLPPDFEVQYHTHPDKHVSPPTPEDLMALLKNNRQQAEIIFRNGQAFVIIKTPSTRALSKLPATQLFKKLDKAFLSSEGKDWEHKWKQELEKMGFIVYINNNPHEKLLVKIKPVEPKKRRRLKRWDS